MNSLKVAQEIQDAVAEGRPVVALETTIVTHGMPYPVNVQTAREVEGVVRQAGAIPATIGVLHGRVCVGLNPDELETLARLPNSFKLSSRDLPFAVATGKSGGTTVAATLAIAAHAGIGVFATGGIGGAHRGAQHHFDISADLLALSRTSLAVVCAGPKAILDIPLTLELLETLNVPVLGYRCDRVPAFYYRDSGCPVTHRVESAEEIARFVVANRGLRSCGGPLVVVPVPEESAMDRLQIEAAIAAALARAERDGVRGKEVTPYLLSALERETEGLSLRTNIALIKNNARVAADVAVAYANFSARDL